MFQKKLEKVIADWAGVEEAVILPNTRLTDLITGNFRSRTDLELADLKLMLEVAFDRDIPDDIFGDFETPSDIYHYGLDQNKQCSLFTEQPEEKIQPSLFTSCFTSLPS